MFPRQAEERHAICFLLLWSHSLTATPFFAVSSLRPRPEWGGVASHAALSYVSVVISVVLARLNIRKEPHIFVFVGLVPQYILYF